MKTKTWLRLLSVMLSVLLILEIMPMNVIAAAVTEERSLSAESDGDAEIADPAEGQTSDVTVIGEDETKREENVKHFMMSDGSFTAVTYSQPVHYKTEENGNWTDIDNTLSEHTDSDGVKYFSPVSSPIDVKLAKDSTEDTLAAYTVGDKTVSWVYDDPDFGFLKNKSRIKKVAPDVSVQSADDAVPAPENTEDSARYSHLYSNVDIEYTVTPSGLKENIILKSKKARNVFDITYNIGSLTAEQTDSRTVTLFDTDADATLIIAAPCMTDSLGESSDKVSLEIISQSSGILKLRMTADREWLDSESREYPVTVDPYIIENKRTSVQNASALYKSGVSYPYGTLAVGKNYAYGKCRSYVKFDMPSLKSGDMVIGASLNLCQFPEDMGYSLDGSNASSVQVNVAEPVGDWSESAVCASSGFLNIPAPGNTVVDYQDITYLSQAEWRTFDVSSSVKRWYVDPSSNYGFVLYSQTESISASEYIGFVSDYFGAEAMPTLVISYINNKGLEDRWTYHSQSLGGAGVSYVNDCTGNLVVVSPITSTNGCNSPMSLSLVYNGYQSGSSVSGQGAAGLGWRFDCQQKISAISSSSTDSLLKNLYNNGFRYIYTDADGTEHYFKLKDGSSTEYVDDEGLKYTLKLGSTNEEKYILSFESGGKISFTYNGYVRKIYDADNNYYRYNYNDSTYSLSYSKITSIVDGGGRTVQLGYDENRNIINVKDFANRNISFTYDSSKRLTAITYPDGGKTSFTYDSQNRLTKCVSVTGEEIHYGYNSSSTVDESVANRVARVSRHYSGNNDDIYMTMDYSAGSSTVFTDSKNRSEKYLFDNAGRTVCVTDALGNAAKYTYTSDSSAAKNNLSSVMTKTAFVDNMLTNHSFEQYSESASNKFTGWVNYGSGGTVTADTSAAMLGNKAACINKTDSGRITVYQAIVVDGKRLKIGGTYTFSTYIKTDSAATAAYIFANCIDNSVSPSVATTFKSSTVNEKLGSYTRVFVTFTIPEKTHHVNFAVTSSGTSGKTWFDCAQVEEGSAANDYNLVENGGFEINGSWTGSGLDSAKDSISTSSASGSRSYKITGAASAKKYLYQDIPVNKPANKCAFSFSGKVTADSVPLTAGQGRYVSINSVLFFSDGTDQYDNIMFTPDIHDTQFTTGIIKAKQENSSKTISKIRVRLIYYKNMNTAYFDDISLNLDETGTSYTYDSKGNLISAKDNADRNQKYTYNNYNDLVKSEFEDNTSYTYTYDENGNNKHRLLSAKSVKSNITVDYTYDNKGHCQNVTVSSDAIDKQIVTRTVYGGTNARYLTSTTDALGNMTKYAYNDDTGLTASVSKPSGTKTSYTYDSKTDALTSVTEDKSTVSYTYNSDRSLKSIQSPTSTYGFLYNECGELSSVSVGSQTLTTNTYNSDTRLLKRQTYGNGDSIAHGYDNYDRPTKLTYRKNGALVDSYSWEYDSKGNVASYTENGNTDKSMLYTYDLSGRLVQSMVRDGSVYIRPSYDEKNLTTGIKYKFSGTTGSMTYTYNEKMDNAPAKSDFGSGAVTVAKYDALGRRSTYAAMLENTKYIYMEGYDYLDNPTDSTKTSGTVSTLSFANINVPSLSYSYDSNGNITQISPSDNSGDYRYTYDKHDQILTAYSAKDGYYIKYTYDYGGNITSKKYYNAEDQSTLEKSVSYVYSDSSWKDKLTMYNGKPITYDEIGNMLSFDSQNFSWVGRRLVNYTKGSVDTDYIYNSDGIRTQKMVGTVTTDYLVNGTQILAERRGGTMIKYFYDSDGRRAAFKTGNKYYFYVYNIQGDVTHIVDMDRNIVASYDYDPYGKILNLDTLTDIGKINPFRYRGYYYDSESDLYYLNSRYYNPEIGRFINADSQIAGVGGDILGLNLFAYCMNNPVNKSDDTGNWPKWAKKMVAAVAVVAVVAVCAAITVATAGATAPIACFAVGAAKGAAIGFAVGAATGAAGGAISHRISTGSWNGAGEAALNGMSNGALSGAVSGAITGGIRGSLSCNSGATSAGKGFDTFRQLKKEIGSPGAGNEWHHIVEQNQIEKSGFSPRMIHNTNNVTPVSKTVHKAISGYYSSKQPFTNGMRVREWLVGQSFSAQYEFGINVIKMFM